MNSSCGKFLGIWFVPMPGKGTCWVPKLFVGCRVLARVPEGVPCCPKTPVAVEPNEEAVREAALRSTGTVPMLVRLDWLTGVLITDTPAPVVA